MSKICKKCSNYHYANSNQDENGCVLKQPLANCPHLLVIYNLPDMWANYAKKGNVDVGKKWFNLGVCKCADDLVEAFENRGEDVNV